MTIDYQNNRIDHGCHARGVKTKQWAPIMMTSQHIYYRAHCSICGQRACVTLVVGWENSRQANTRCAFVPDDAPANQFQCTGSCCHGCECLQGNDCGDYEPGQCPCDCHLEKLRLHTIKIDLASLEELEEDTRCPCSACRSFNLVPVERVYVASNDMEESGGDEDGGDHKGYWTINRPPNCRYYHTGDISTYYNNDDGKNHRLNDYFPRFSSPLIYLK